MRRSVLLATAAALLPAVALVGATNAQQPNIPGIISGAVEGNAAGAINSARGYDYWGQSGYYPGSQGSPYGPYYGPGTNGAYSQYSGYPAYRRYPVYRDGTRTSYRPLMRNPSVDAKPYHAVIVNAEENQATLRFAVNGEQYALPPGKQIEFSGRTPREIRFDRGSGDAVARYTLADGRFEFSPSKKGWELYRHPLEKTSPEQATTSDTESVEPDEAARPAADGVAPNPEPQR